jgi:hypothetical protein
MRPECLRPWRRRCGIAVNKSAGGGDAADRQSRDVWDISTEVRIYSLGFTVKPQSNMWRSGEEVRS